MDEQPTWPFGGIWAALGEGVIELAGKPVGLSVVDCGELSVASGHLLAIDLFGPNEDDGLGVRVPPGRYPVRLTLADVSGRLDGSNLVEAYLSVVLGDGEESSRRVLGPEGEGDDGAPLALEDEAEEVDDPEGEEDPESEEDLEGDEEEDDEDDEDDDEEGDLVEGEFRAVAVDSDTVALVDEDALVSLMPDPSAWEDDVFAGGPDPWYDVLDDPDEVREGAANVELPGAERGENAILCRAGWGDGRYPFVGSFDESGDLIAVHLDLQVVGTFE
ncbi:MAG TPA: DUF4241 domain-containing protein [Candidatus Dormibacteraeota bacterium]|nr:DUF4241 domain-containing protein [Candidatus Dormibacteraeota bacterium]